MSGLSINRLDSEIKNASIRMNISSSTTNSYLQETIFKNMKNYSDGIGIDVSKLTIDAHIRNRVVHRVFSNTAKGYKVLLSRTDTYLKEQVYFFLF